MPLCLSRVALCVLFFLAGSTGRLTATAQPLFPRIASVTIEGNTLFTTREVLDWLSSRPSTPFSEPAVEADLSALRGRYREAGYFNVSLSSHHEMIGGDSSSVGLRITIVEGKRTVFGGVRLRGERAGLGTPGLEELERRRGDPFDSRRLELDIEALLSSYEQQGYPLVACSIDSISYSRGNDVDSAIVHLTLTGGPRMTIDEVRVDGNSETSADVILRETRLRSGEPFHPDRIAAIRRRLVRLNIFSSVAEPELFVRGSRGGLLLRVQEGNTNTFDGVAGYIPGTVSGESGYLTGLVSVSMRNLFGTARKLQFRWQKEDRISQELDVAYGEPWLFGIPLNAALEFHQRRQDSSYVKQGIRTRAEILVSEELSLSGVFGTESVIPSAETSLPGISRSTTLTFGAELLYDTRDDLYSPRSGVRYRAGYSFGRKRLASSGTTPSVTEEIQRFDLDLESFFELFFRQVVMVGLHGRQVQGGGIDITEFYRFGGARTLRGYRENQFLGSRVGWATTEYRFLLGSHSFLYGFFDSGYYFRPVDPLRAGSGAEAFLYGYGIGLRFDTSLGNLGVSFALGKGDSFSQGKIHLGVVNEF